MVEGLTDHPFALSPSLFILMPLLSNPLPPFNPLMILVGSSTHAFGRVAVSGLLQVQCCVLKNS